MFKNQLFLKIIFIFTLPALGILYFSSKLVYDKFLQTKDIHLSIDMIDYIKATNSLIHSLQKERGLSVLYNQDQQFFKDLEIQRRISNEKYDEYLKIALKSVDKHLVETLNVRVIQDKYYVMQDFRQKITARAFNNFTILDFYSKFDNKLIENIDDIDHKTFSKEFLNIFHFLTLKEYAGVERALVAYVLEKKTLNSDVHERLLNSFVFQEISYEYFKSNIDLVVLNFYNEKLTLSLENDVKKYRDNLKEIAGLGTYDVRTWWDLSTKRIEALDDVFDFIVIDLERKAKKLKRQADMDEKFSLFFLCVSFITLSALLFVLRNVIFNEQKSFEKIGKQKKVYEIINQVSKQLITKNSKQEIFEEINELISKDSNMVFSFIYDFTEDSNKKKIYALDGILKNLLIERIDEYNSKNSDNLLTRTQKWKTNIIVENFGAENISVFSSDAKKYDIRSAASFPIKKFDKIVAALVIYSNESRFFDYEVEILFNTLVLDINHTLEKFEYESLRLNQEKQLRISSVAFESSEPMIITDDKAHIIEANHAFCDFMKYNKFELIGKNPRMFRSPHQNKEFYTAMWDSIKKRGSWSGEIYNVSGQKEIIPVRLSITAVKDEKGKIVNYLGQYFDISDLKDREQILEYQATHDNLTGLPNRLLLLDRIEHAITKVVRHKIIGGLIFIDLDNFKIINDTMGHDVGDLLLVEVAKKLKSVVRDEDTISRIGGDEFIVLADNIGANNVDALKNIEILANKIKDGLNEIESLDGHKNISTPSIGVTLFSDASVCVKDLIKQADQAMYEAKRQGKNTIEFFN